jgi:hypothetical protein
MKKVTEKAKQYESKKSLDGKMKMLKGNVGKIQTKGKGFPDVSGDGKITKKDILIAKGVIPAKKKK